MFKRKMTAVILGLSAFAPRLAFAAAAAAGGGMPYSTGLNTFKTSVTEGIASVVMKTTLRWNTMRTRQA